jgi:hypothetical protein
MITTNVGSLSIILEIEVCGFTGLLRTGRTTEEHTLCPEVTPLLCDMGFWENALYTIEGYLSQRPFGRVAGSETSHSSRFTANNPATVGQAGSSMLRVLTPDP